MVYPQKARFASALKTYSESLTPEGTINSLRLRRGVLLERTDSNFSTVNCRSSVCFQEIDSGEPSVAAGLSPRILGNSQMLMSPHARVFSEPPVATGESSTVLFSIDFIVLSVFCLMERRNLVPRDRDYV